MVMRARVIEGSLSEVVKFVWGLEPSVGVHQSLGSRDAKYDGDCTALRVSRLLWTSKSLPQSPWIPIRLLEQQPKLIKKHPLW